MRACREAKGITRVMLSSITGVCVNSIYDAENDRNVTISTVELLADGIGVSIDEYVGHKKGALQWN